MSNVRQDLQHERDGLITFMVSELELFLYLRITSKALRKISGRSEVEDGKKVAIAVVVQSLHDLDRLVEELRDQYQSLGDRLQHVFRHTTETIHAVHYVELQQSKERPELLQQLFQLLFEQFVFIAEAHGRFLDEINQLRFSVDVDAAMKKSLMVYDMADVWLAIEGIMQRILAHYLDQKNEEIKELVDKREQVFAERIRTAWTRKRPKKIQGVRKKIIYHVKTFSSRMLILTRQFQN